MDNHMGFGQHDAHPPLPPPAPEYLKLKKHKKKKKFTNTWWFPLSLLVGVAVVLGTFLQWGTDAIADLISPSAEQNLGALLLQDISDSQHVLENKELNHAILQLLQTVQKVNNPAGEPPVWARNLKVILLDTDLPNAFALPGGVILVTRGLLCTTERGEELAYVLAHEMGHIHYRHPLRQAVRTFGLQLIQSILSGGGNSGLMVMLLNNTYSRHFEHQADMFALEAGRKLGWDSRNFSSLLERVSKLMGDDGPMGDLSVLRDHPVLQERVKQASKFPHPRGSVQDTLASLMDVIHGVCDSEKQDDQSGH